LNDSCINGKFLKAIGAECASTATFYENIIIKREEKMCPVNLIFKDSFKVLKVYNRFFELSVVKTKEKIQSKLSDRGTVCFFVGHPSNNANNLYRLLNPITKHIIKSKNVIWLNKIYG
jgi:hypothetical protein